MFIPRVSRAALCLLTLAVFACSGDGPVAPTQSARVFTVDPYGDTGYRTIQSALDASSDGDTISLVNGRHMGPGNRDLDFGGRSIVLRSERGSPLHCIIDAEGYYLQPPEPHFNLRFGLKSALERPYGPPPVVVVENLRIEDGYEAVLCDSGSAPVFRNCTFEYSYRAVVSKAASPTFVNCTFTNNRGALACEPGSSVIVQGGQVWGNWSSQDAAGITVRSSALRVSDCLFRGNSTSDQGAAIYSFTEWDADRSRVEATNCQFQHSGWNEAVWLSRTDFLFDGCVFSDNEGPMFIYDDSAGRIVGSVFYGEAIYLNSGSSASIESCIIAFNDIGPGVDCGWDGTASVTLSCTDLYGNNEDCMRDQIGINGNVSVDPMFCYFVDGNYVLYPDSPVVTNTDCLPEGGWPVGCGPVTAGPGQRAE